MLAEDGYDVRSLKHAIVLRTPTGSAECGVKRTLRGGELAGSGVRILSHGKLSIDTAARTVMFASTPVRLRRREYELLVYRRATPLASSRGTSCFEMCGATRQKE